MKKFALALTLALAGGLTSLSANADTLGGLYVGAQAWQMGSDGSFGSAGSSAEFDFQDETQGVYYVALEHPIFFLPDLKLRYNNLSTSGDAEVSSFSFGGQTYNGEVRANVDLSHTDFILYYELLDNGLISLDLGVNVKYLDGEITVVDKSGTNSQQSLRTPAPLGYLKAELGLPLTGLSTFGELNYLTYDGHTLSDYQLGLAYQFIDNMAIDMNIHAGYRDVHFKLDDLDGVDTDINFNGAFAGLEVHF